MRVLGICHDVLIASAALVEDGAVRCAVPEERIDRRKQSRGFPHRAVAWCLAEAGITLAEVDEIAIAWNPAIDLETIPSGWLDSRRHRGEHLLQVPGQLMRMTRATAPEQLVLLSSGGELPPVTFVNHYDAHVGNALLQSGWDEAAVCVMDGRAERQTAMLGVARGAEVRTFAEVAFPHSLGLFYGAVTQFLGFRADSDEWKVMALGSATDPRNDVTDRLRELVTVDDDGRFRIALEYFEYYNQFDRRMYSDRFVECFGKPRRPDEELTEEHERLAAAVQQVFEESAAAVLRALHRRSGMSRVALSGGCFMNSVFNGRIPELTPFEESFVSSCPDDSGTAVGAALFVAALRAGERPVGRVLSNAWGPAATDEECLEVVRRFGLPRAEVVADPAAAAARDLAEGRIVGWVQGRCEFGQRALGNRSILLDPRRTDGKDVVNAAVKYRESFRPFAPAVLEERIAEWFECEPGTIVPFMERVLRFRPELVDRVPAVVHTDGTGRVQTVGAANQPRFRRLIEHFAELTGVPMVLNTSFNLNGEPIVCSPADAVRTFYSCGLEVLYLGDVRISK